MTEGLSKDLIQAKIDFANLFEASVERDRKKEVAAGETDSRVEERRRVLFECSIDTLEPEVA